MSFRRFVFDLKLRTVRRRSLSLYRNLMGYQRIAPEELHQLQMQRSGQIASFAMTASGFYRRLYEAHGLTPADVTNPEVWATIPIIDRSVVKANAEEFQTPEAGNGNSRDAKTGGSTGEPLKILHDARVPTLALSWRMYSWWGVAPFDNIARIGRWGFGARETLKNNLSWWPTKQVYLDAGFINRDTMRRFHDSLTRAKPTLLEGYVGAMLEFADFLEIHRLRLPQLMAVAATAAPLTEAVRTRLQEILGAPVYDEYRCSETGWTAGECRRQHGLHVFADMRRLEVVGQDGTPLPPGETGDLVVTDLANRVFPLIRYRLGDRGRMLDETCACGITLPLMANPDGRTTDLIRLPSGAVLAHRLMAIFSEEPAAVRLFQIHQLKDYSIIVRVVLGEVPQAQAHVERIAQTLRDRISGEVPVKVEYVDSIPYNGGKVKYIISDV